MTEAEWQELSDPRQMLAWLIDIGRVSDRKLRLYSVGCCRRITHLFPDARCLAALQIAELFADGLADDQQLKEAADAACEAATEAQAGSMFGGTYAELELTAPFDAAATAAGIDPIGTHFTVRQAILYAAGHRWGTMIQPELKKIEEAESNAQVALLIDMFGNPFTLDNLSAWLTRNNGTIPQLAQAIYDERVVPEGTLDNGHMAVLSDALEEAGCQEPEVLGHCRSGGVHVRGCWLLDRILGKE
jgi:hypothetical protein